MKGDDKVGFFAKSQVKRELIQGLKDKRRGAKFPFPLEPCF
jgi:hypothetical protein